MPKGPQGQKRPADVIGAAIRVARIATGEEDDDLQVEQASQSKGGNARASALTASERKSIARKAAATRWKA
jgi:hypothetical protein